MNNDLSKLVEAVRAAHADIAPTYAEYVQLAFAIATDCGEAGRSDFISLCEPSPKFNALHANKLFSSALRTGNQNVHLGTAFHLAKLAGVEIGFKFQGFTKPFSSHTRVSTYNIADTVDQAHETSDRETEANDAPLHIGSEPYTSLPRLVPGYPWPSLLRDILGFADNAEQRDILLLTALTALGATLGKTVRCLYGMHWIYPCIQLFVIAPPASGKGIMAWLRKFIEPIHREIRQQVDLAMKQYRQDLAAYHALGKEKAKMEMPQMPKNSMFIISGNNTGTGILQNIIDSDGTGIIFETEADTITTAIGGDYGHWSDTLRNAFDHAGLSFNRRTDNEYRECDSTFLSMVLSGTPGQVAPLIPSGENGLFSREVFYYKSQIREWIDQFSVDEVDAEGIPPDGLRVEGHDRSAQVPGYHYLAPRRAATSRFQRQLRTSLPPCPAIQRAGDEQFRGTPRHQPRTFHGGGSHASCLGTTGITAAGPRHQQRQPKGQDHRRLGTPYHRR